jgi:hypothetical protein
MGAVVLRWTGMKNRFIMSLLRLRDYMPKFYHDKRNGFDYHSCGVGWRKIPPFNLLPYLTGDVIRIRISLKPLQKGQKWQTGIIEVEPPEFSREYPQINFSDTVFSLIDISTWPNGTSSAPMYEFPMDTKWSRIIALKEGVDFFQPCHIKSTLVLQNIIDKKSIRSATMPIANIEVVSNPMFYMWVFTTIVAIAAFIVALIRRC